MIDQLPDPAGFLGPESRTDAFGPPTKWTWIDVIAGRVPGDVESAWRAMIDRYRDPIRRSLLRRLAGRCDANRAEEITEEFFGDLVLGDILAKAEKQRGRFRQFISGVMKLYVLTKLREGRGGPGGGAAAGAGSIDSLGTDLEAPPDPDNLDDRELADWARALLGRAWARLDADNRRAARILAAFYGIAPAELKPSSRICEEEMMSPQALHTALSRGRSLLNARIQDEVRETIQPDDFASEYATIKTEILALHPGIL